MIWLSLFWALLALNIYRPYRGNNDVLMVVSFVFGMPVAELALHMIGIEALITVMVAWCGGLEGFGDALSLLIAFAAWAAMAIHYALGLRTDREMEAGIVAALGADYRDLIPAERAAQIPLQANVDKLLRPFRIAEPEVRVVKNIQYAQEGAQRLLLDVYHLRDKPANAPVLFQIHGGAWMENLGDKNQQALPLMHQLAKHGWVCVTVDYRLSPSATFPDHIIDCKRALAWTKANIAGYGGDAGFIVATGGSAGGHLSALLAYSANDPDYQPGFESADTTVQGLVSVYGIHDWTNSKNQRHTDGLSKTLEDTIVKRSLSEAPELYRKASPLHRVSVDSVPTLLVHGAADTLAMVEESDALYAELQSAGVRAGIVRISLAQHAFELFNSLRAQLFVNGVERFVTALHGEYLQAKTGSKTAVAKKPAAKKKAAAKKPPAKKKAVAKKKAPAKKKAAKKAVAEKPSTAPASAAPADSADVAAPAASGNDGKIPGSGD